MTKTLNPVWYLYAYASIFHEDDTFLALASEEESYKNEIEGFYGYLANYLTLTKDKTLTGEISLTYFTGFIFGSYLIDESLNLNLGIQKNLWQNRATLAIRAEDVLGQVNSRYISRYYNQDNSYLAVPETQFVRISFTYNFGNYKLSENKRSIRKSERDRLDNE